MPSTAAQADALWRAATYVSVVQLHLSSNVLLHEPLRHEHVKPRAGGHWGTVPGTAWILSQLALADPAAGRRVIPMLGAGHAGVIQLAFAWLSGRLAEVRPRLRRDAEGLRRLACSFPDVDGLGSEVHPGLPFGDYLGGCLGGALAFAHGAALDAADRIVVPVLGDGECETPTTAAAWTAAVALDSPPVLPVVHLNGFRMGGRSLLGDRTDDELRSYWAGLGWAADIVHVAAGTAAEQATFATALRAALERVAARERVVLVLRCLKGWGGPDAVDGQEILGTHRAHKTPLGRAADDPAQLGQLERWLLSYQPAELFRRDGAPAGDLAAALCHARWEGLGDATAGAAPWSPPAPAPATFAGAVTEAARMQHERSGAFRLFSPDELESNRLGSLVDEPWTTAEVLAEEVVLGWLLGWLAGGGRGLLVSYEAFAPLLTAGIIGHLKQRRLRDRRAPSLNLMLTSYGWHNVYTHGDPSLSTALLATCDPAVRVLTPADPLRTAAALSEALGSDGRVNVVVAGKHSTETYRPDRVSAELERGLAVWDGAGTAEPDITIVAVGDLPAAVATSVAPLLARGHSCTARVVNVLDVTVLGDPAVWPRGLDSAEVAVHFGQHAPLLVLTLGHPSAIWGLLAGRHQRLVDVIGWREPAEPMPQARLAAELGLDVQGALRAALRLVQAARGRAG